MARAPDLIPLEAISLSQAFERLCEKVHEDPHVLPAFDDDWAEALKKSQATEKQFGDPEGYDAETEQWCLERRMANLFLRLQLADGKLLACVRDPKNGEILQLGRDGWLPEAWLDYTPYGIWDDYIDNKDYDSPGPGGSFIGNARRRVFFPVNLFGRWLNSNFPTSRGRPPGSGSFKDIDNPILEKMKILLANKTVASPTQAAKLLAREAHGQSEEAKVKRLVKRYNNKAF